MDAESIVDNKGAPVAELVIVVAAVAAAALVKVDVVRVVDVTRATFPTVNFAST